MVKLFGKEPQNSLHTSMVYRYFLFVKTEAFLFVLLSLDTTYSGGGYVQSGHSVGKSK